MKLYTITASDIATAMETVRARLGEDAIIVSSSKEGNNLIKVTAAVDRAPDNQTDIKPAKDAKQKKLEEYSTQILKFHKLPGRIIDEIMQPIANGKFDSEKSAIEHSLAKNFTFAPLNFKQSRPLMLFGMPGIGKTLAISKMMTEATFHDKPVSVITTDIKRAGGVEQLSAFTRILKIDLKIARNPEQLKKYIDESQGKITLIDTAGVNPLNSKEIQSLIELISVADIDPVMVMSSGGDVEEAVDMARAFRPVLPKKLIITKADSARRFGSIITAARIMGLSFTNFSGNPNVARSLEPISAKSFTTLLMRPFE